MSLTLRQRVTAWSAGLVVATGVAAVLVVVVLSGRMLDRRSHEATAAVRAEQGQPGAIGPNGLPLPGQGPAAQVANPGGPLPADAARREAAHTTFHDVRNIGLATVVVMGVLAVGASWVAAGRVVQPLHTVTRTARSITRDSRLDRRIGHDGPDDDVRELADAFDGMLDRLEAVFDAQRSFVSNTSHELRTPLAVMQTEVDVALDDPNADEASLRASLKAIGDEVRSTSGLVGAMLQLARAEAITDPVAADLAASAARALEGLGPEFRGEHRVVDELGEAPVVGDRVLLDQLVGNLVRNAEKYNRPGGLLSVTTGQVGDRSVVVVENDGPMVDAATTERLFGRFVRRSEAGEGYGLGLAIVNAIVLTHAGTVAAQARPEGGLRVQVSLPTRRG